MGKYNSYTPEQEVFLISNAYGVTRKELTGMFNHQFNTNKSVLAIKTWCNNRGIRSGSDGKFKDNHISWQTGVSGERYKNHFTLSSFTKSIVGLLGKRTYQVGDEIIRHGIPYIIVCVDANTVLDKRIVAKRRYVYEQSYGKIPTGHRIIHLDNNKMNCELDNLRCIPTKYIPIINKNHWFTDSREHTLTALKWCELYYTLHNKKKGGIW